MSRQRSGVAYQMFGSAPPYLPGAKCVGEHKLFDATAYRSLMNLDEHYEYSSDYARTEAKKICASCPALDMCRQWVKGLRSYDRPSGVVAGEMYSRVPDSRAKSTRLARARDEQQSLTGPATEEEINNVIDIIARLERLKR